MNVFQAEVLNSITSHQYDWSPAEILAHIIRMRTDFPDKPTIRMVQRALLALHELDKVTRDRTSKQSPYRYRMAIPKMLTYSEAIAGLKEVIPIWPPTLIGQMFILFGLGVLYSVVGVLDLTIDIIKWIF